MQTPASLVSEAQEDLGLQIVAQRRNAAGLHGQAAGPGEFQLSLVNGARAGQPLSAVIPLDASARGRLSAIDRFIKVQSGRVHPDWRLTLAQRRRLALMLRALDGRTEGASHLDLASALFGRRMIDPALWHASSFRYMTLRLVRDGLKMVDGGYRQLLRPRRLA